MFPIAKIWMQFIFTRISFAFNMSNINAFWAILLYCILQRRQLCICKWIYKALFTCISEKKVKIFFPYLVTTLYKKAKVPMSTTKQFVKPTKSILRNSIYTKYVELNCKHIQDWNERWKKNMDAPLSLNRKMKEKGQGIGDMTDIE